MLGVNWELEESGGKIIAGQFNLNMILHLHLSLVNK